MLIVVYKTTAQTIALAWKIMKLLPFCYAELEQPELPWRHFAPILKSYSYLIHHQKKRRFFFLKKKINLDSERTAIEVKKPPLREVL